MIKLTVPLASSSLTKPASSTKSRSPLVGRPNGSCHLRSSASLVLRSGDVDNDGALVVLSDCSDSAGVASSWHLYVAACVLVSCAWLLTPQ